MSGSPKLTFEVVSQRIDAHGSVSRCKQAEIPLDTDLAGNPHAFNPAELLLAALSACIIKGIERVTPILRFSHRGLEVRVRGVRQDVPPKLEAIHYEIVVDTDEPDRQLELLHENVRKYGTVFNTVAPGTTLTGVLRRRRSNAGDLEAEPGAE
ncbi:OsmC family protein [Planctellipticum variicoloris]|uniref:OsmC family protein n=1 Tax=Planctellipticum variicoloris TaxID=3064265 RepID=UPI003013B020|nr:OsmC family protein [Planctomycetaceae bacterium SH412]